MKKIFPFILSALLCISLFSCNTHIVDITKETTEAEETTGTNEIEETGMTFATNICEFTVEYINITNDVIPPKTKSSGYSHYASEVGKLYVDLCLAYKNTGTSNIFVNEVISGQLIYRGKYAYDGFSVIEKDNRTDFASADTMSIAPLSTEYVHYLFEIHEEVETSGSEIILEMNICGEDYKIIVRK